MAFELSELRQQFLHDVARVRRDPAALLPAKDWKPGLLKRPLVCTGSSNPLAAGLRAKLRGKLLAIIDDTRTGSSEGVPLVTTRGLRELHARHPDLLLINCAMLEAGRAHFARAAAALGIDCVDTLQFHRLLRLVDGHTLQPAVESAPLFMMDEPLAFFDDTIAHAEAFLALDFADELSALTLLHLLLFRLSFDPTHLSRASVGGHEAAPGPSSYVFDTSLFSFSEREHFVDGGAYRGETFERFLSICDDGTVHAFEPEPINLAYCRAKAMELCGPGFEARIRIDGRALWERAGSLQFSSQDYQELRRGASHLIVSEDVGGTPVVSIDEALDRPPTLLKLELEGAESWALRGSIRTITRHRPKLSIGVYHRPLDLLDVTRQLLDLRADYKLYLRHHLPTDWVTTVCYAVPF